MVPNKPQRSKLYCYGDTWASRIAIPSLKTKLHDKGPSFGPKRSKLPKTPRSKYTRGKLEALYLFWMPNEEMIPNAWAQGTQVLLLPLLFFFFPTFLHKNEPKRSNTHTTRKKGRTRVFWGWRISEEAKWEAIMGFKYVSNPKIRVLPPGRVRWAYTMVPCAYASPSRVSFSHYAQRTTGYAPHTAYG